MAKEIEITMKNTINQNITLNTAIVEDENHAARIEAKNIKVWYEDFMAIKGISIKIKPNTELHLLDHQVVENLLFFVYLIG